MGAKKDPNTAAFNDDFTKEFMVSPEEEREGYYQFESKTGGYTMLFPKNAELDEDHYEKDKDNFEALYYGENDKQRNTSSSVDIIYENSKSMNYVKQNVDSLSDTINYQGDYNNIHLSKKTIYYAKSIQHFKGSDDKVYRFFGFIKPKNSHKGMRFIYEVQPLKKNENKQLDINEQEKRARMLMQSIDFDS